MMAEITNESDFYFWIVEYLHKLGPVKQYPKALTEAADLALRAIANSEDEEEVLAELVPGVEPCPCCDGRVGYFGVVFHLARQINKRRPYSAAVIRFLAECYGSVACPMYEEGSRIGLRVAKLHRTGFFKEYKEKRQLHLMTTERGSRELGVSVHLSYPEHSPFFPKSERLPRTFTPPSRPTARVIRPEQWRR